MPSKRSFSEAAIRTLEPRARSKDSNAKFHSPRSDLFAPRFLFSFKGAFLTTSCLLEHGF